MKYFILITFIIFSNFSYATDSSILCDGTFLTSATPQDISDTLFNIRHEDRRSARGITNRLRELIFSNREALMTSALLQTCDEKTGDTPIHLAARLGAEFGVINMLIQQESDYTPRLYLNEPIMRKNKSDQTPVDILRARLIEDLPAHVIDNLDTLLELYVMQQTAIECPLRGRRSLTKLRYGTIF